jgi:hypothetical protein
MGDLERELDWSTAAEAERLSREKIASGWQVVTFLGMCMATVVALVWILH